MLYKELPGIERGKECRETPVKLVGVRIQRREGAQFDGRRMELRVGS